MKKKDCMNCKNCTLRPMAYNNAFTNVCDFEDKIAELLKEKLMERIKNKTCDWFEKGEPKVSNEVYYED